LNSINPSGLAEKFSISLILLAFLSVVIGTKSKAVTTMSQQEASEKVIFLADALCKAAKTQRQMMGMYGELSGGSANGSSASSALKLLDAWVIRNYTELRASEAEFGYSMQEVWIQPAKNRIMQTC
jgi:hypothetical protein